MAVHMTIKLLNAGLLFLQDPTAAHYMFQDDPFLMPRNAANSVGISFYFLDSFLLPLSRLRILLPN